MTTMDAQTIIRFGQTARGSVSAMTMAGRSIKDHILAGETLNVSENCYGS